MIESRVKKAIGKMITIFATVDDATFENTKSLYFLYFLYSLYLPPIIFNCQSWTNITKKYIKLSPVQQKYLNRVLKLPHLTSNSFVYLAMGILPYWVWDHQKTTRISPSCVKSVCKWPSAQSDESLPREKNVWDTRKSRTSMIVG